MQPQGARVVTPEAVVLDVRTAGLGSRALARAIDGLIQGAALVALLVATGAVAASSSAGLGTVGLVVDLVFVTLILFGYPIILESLWRGRTVGKAALGIRVVTSQGAPIRFRHALVRGLLGLVEVMALPVVGVVSMLVSRRDQRLGDLAAGTIVIRERTAGAVTAPVTFFPPPGWESFVATLDVSGVTASEYENARSFLIRARDMAPVPRINLAGRLAGPLAERLHQPVPAGAGPELWLACVATAYQRRHGGPATAGPRAAVWGPPPAAARLDQLTPSPPAGARLDQLTPSPPAGARLDQLTPSPPGAWGPRPSPPPSVWPEPPPAGTGQAPPPSVWPEPPPAGTDQAPPPSVWPEPPPAGTGQAPPPAQPVPAVPAPAVPAPAAPAPAVPAPAVPAPAVPAPAAPFSPGKPASDFAPPD